MNIKSFERDYNFEFTAPSVGLIFAFKKGGMTCERLLDPNEPIVNATIGHQVIFPYEGKLSITPNCTSSSPIADYDYFVLDYPLREINERLDNKKKWNIKMVINFD